MGKHKIGDKYYEMMPSWVKPEGSRFDYVLEITGFKKESRGDFAVCKRTYPDGRTDEVGISLEILDNPEVYSFKPLA